MAGMQTNAKVKSATTSAVIIRADGTVVDLGVIASYHRNPFVRARTAIRKKLKRA